MKAKSLTEFIILELIYVTPHIEIDFPVVENFQTPRGPPFTSHSILNWYYRVMSEEESEIPNGNKVQFRMWRIKSHVAKLFTIYNIRFDKLLIFVGEQTIHWMFCSSKSIFTCVEGVTPLTLSYCCCCFHEQYLKFVECIQQDNQDPSGYLLS